MLLSGPGRALAETGAPQHSFARSGQPRSRSPRRAVRSSAARPLSGTSRRGGALLPRETAPPAEQLDDLSRCSSSRWQISPRISRDSFYFGCEADDPINALAFNMRSTRMACDSTRSSDPTSATGMWRMPTSVVEEAYELVERGLITEADFRDFISQPREALRRQQPDVLRRHTRARLQ